MPERGVTERELLQKRRTARAQDAEPVPSAQIPGASLHVHEGFDVLGIFDGGAAVIASWMTDRALFDVARDPDFALGRDEGERLSDPVGGYRVVVLVEADVRRLSSAQKPAGTDANQDSPAGFGYFQPF